MGFIFLFPYVRMAVICKPLSMNTYKSVAKGNNGCIIEDIDITNLPHKKQYFVRARGISFGQDTKNGLFRVFIENGNSIILAKSDVVSSWWCVFIDEEKLCAGIKLVRWCLPKILDPPIRTCRLSIAEGL